MPGLLSPHPTLAARWLNVQARHSLEKRRKCPANALKCSGCQVPGIGRHQEGEAPGAPSAGWSNGWVRDGQPAPAPSGGGWLIHHRNPLGAWRPACVLWCKVPAGVHRALTHLSGPSTLAGGSVTHPRLSSQTAPTVWGFLAILGKQSACPMTKDFSPTGGAQATEGPLGVVGELSRSCQAA